MAIEEADGTRITADQDTQPKPGILPELEVPVRKKSMQYRTKISSRKPRILQRGAVVLAVLVVAFGGGWFGAASYGNRNTQTNTETQRIVLNEQSELISSIADKVGKSVVSVNVTSQVTTQSFFGYSDTSEQQSAGTGVVIAADGLILTNRHVVPEGATKVSVILSDGTEFETDVVARTSETDSLDIAFLRIKDLGTYKLTVAKLGSSNKMRVGDSVIAIGNALGQFQNTVTTGIISGYGRSVQASDGNGSAVENLEDLFQTDAAINSGNSGGPLVNLNGEVIGINTAVAASAENIGFSIPIDNITSLINSVKTTGKIQRPYLGVVYIALTDDTAKELNLSVNRGAYVPTAADYGQDTVIDGEAADKAGVKEGDVITKLNNTAINEATSLSAALGKYSSGDSVELTVSRGGKTITLKATLGLRTE